MPAMVLSVAPNLPSSMRGIKILVGCSVIYKRKPDSDHGGDENHDPQQLHVPRAPARKKARTGIDAASAPLAAPVRYIYFHLCISLL